MYISFGFLFLKNFSHIVRVLEKDTPPMFSKYGCRFLIFFEIFFVEFRVDFEK
jgi:hypothetical protein